MLKFVVCSVVLGALVWGYQALAYNIAQTSYWGAIAFCGLVAACGLIGAAVVDRSRIDRR